MLYLIVKEDVQIPASVDMVQFRHKEAYMREAVEAALEYYREHKQLVDARIQANEIAVAS